jgi:hypothetical protein
MGNVTPLRIGPTSASRVSDRLALARRLSEAADCIEGKLASSEGFVEEDAVAALRWSAGFLLRVTMREEDVGGALRVVQRVLQDSMLRHPAAAGAVGLAIHGSSDRFGEVISLALAGEEH